MKKIINNNPKGYAEVRNITGAFSGTILHVKDVFVKLLSLNHKIFKRGYHPFFKGFFYYPLHRKTKCVFFNSINLGPQPWEVVFESTLPRLGKAPKWCYTIGIKRLAKSNCKKIVALSQCAYDNQIIYLKKNYPKVAKLIIDKMEVKLPPQSLLVNKYSDKKIPKDKIVFTLIGGDFFRKGGGEVLTVFKELIPKYPQLHLNIVSSLNYGDYATHTTCQDQKNAIDIIEKYPNNITHFERLENAKVLELLVNSHIGLLPTWADSFGYSVLEAQAAGCPVISTDIRALPEVNNDEIGWVIKVPKLKDGNLAIDSEKQRKNFSLMLEEQLQEIVTSIVHTPDIIMKKGILCLNSMHFKHKSI